MFGNLLFLLHFFLLLFFFSFFLSFFPWTMNLSTADLRNYWTEFHETWWSYRYMFLVGPKVFKMSAIFKMAATTRHKKWAVKIQHCPISSKFDMWVDNDVLNWFSTLKDFYRSPFLKWPPQYRKNSTLSDIIKIWYVGR